MNSLLYPGHHRQRSAKLRDDRANSGFPGLLKAIAEATHTPPFRRVQYTSPRPVEMLQTITINNKVKNSILDRQTGITSRDLDMYCKSVSSD